MTRTFFHSKIHRATVTQADLDYEGSVTIDAALMEAARIANLEAVHVWNVTRGTRLVTYAIEGPRGSGTICVNGAAAHLNHPGDVVIIATFAELDEAEASRHVPTVVLVDERNRVKDPRAVEVPGPARRAAPPPPGGVPEPRQEHFYTRTITCRGHCRSDGLWAIEGQLVDTRTYASVSAEGRWSPPGEPIHDLRVTITVDDDYVIRAASAAVQESPFASCVDVTPFYSKLVGLRLATGFASAVRERLGGTAGCTHLNELLSPMATAAFQTIAGGRARRDGGGPPPPDVFGALRDTCYALREGGEVVRKVGRALGDHDTTRTP